MVIVLAFLGRDLPNPGFALVGLLLLGGFVLYSRNNISTGNVQGHGRMYRCERCGRDFQPERVELLSTGDTRHFIDDRCPGCGWDLDWGDPDKRPGGSSGTW